MPCSAADKRFESLRAAREAADLTKWKDAVLRDARVTEKELLSHNLEAAQVSPELRAMVAQSGKQDQSEVLAQLFAAKIATIEQSLAEDSDFHMSLTGNDRLYHDEDGLAIIIAVRMGSESLAPSFRPRRKQAPSIKHKAAAELHQSSDVLQHAELRAECIAEGSRASAMQCS